MKKKQVAIIIGAAVLVGVILLLIFCLPHTGKAEPFGAKLLYELEENGKTRVLEGEPAGIAALGKGEYLVTDCALHLLWKVSDSGAEVLAGSPGEESAVDAFSGGYADGAAAVAQFCSPGAILAFRGGYLIADAGNHVLRFYDPKTNSVQTFAGTGEAGQTDGSLESASFVAPGGMCLDTAGNLYVADAGANAIRKIDTQGYVSTFLGGGEAGFADGAFDVALLNRPSDIAFYEDVFYIADTGNCALRVIDAGEVKTLAGTGDCRYADGKLSVASFCAPTGICVENGIVYAADIGGCAIRKIEGEMVATLSRGDGTASPGAPRFLLYEDGYLLYTDTVFARLFRVKA